MADVGADDREPGLVDARLEVVLTEVELVVADGHDIHAHHVEALEVGLAVEDGRQGSALQDVARLEQEREDMVRLVPGAALVD